MLLASHYSVIPVYFRRNLLFVLITAPLQPTPMASIRTRLCRAREARRLKTVRVRNRALKKWSVAVGPSPSQGRSGTP